MARSRAIGFVAFIEAAKGVVVLLAATGLLSLLHRDVHEIAAKLIEHMHLNPASKYPRIFLEALDVLAILMLNILVVAIMLRALFLRRHADV